jgi:uncharacterized membrane protein YhaH (DUF805 family)
MPLAISMLKMQGDVPNPFRMLFAGPFLLFWLVLFAVVLAGFWKMFQKAGHPGWACLIPIYNVYILLKVAGRPGWWLILFLIPLVNIVVNIIVAMDIAKAFGQSAAFGFFLNFLLCGIGYVILGFGNYRYVGPQGQALAARA